MQSLISPQLTKGAALDRESENAKPNLHWRDIPAEVRSYLKFNAKYSQGCAGKKIEIKFTFRLEGEGSGTLLFGSGSDRQTISSSRPSQFVSAKQPANCVACSKAKCWCSQSFKVRSQWWLHLW